MPGFLAMKETFIFSDPTPNLNPYNNLDLNLSISSTLGLPDSNSFPFPAIWLHSRTIAVTVLKPETAFSRNSALWLLSDEA